ncbi:MAG: hypothetical protein PHQ90_06270 [Sulfuricurvum sp.]|nr:hypothetical protein [Sulfuricurvum sp.]MDD2949698.1 hypothetical protein [Sulfuricurvum sp.]
MISFDILNAIYSYLYEESSSVNFKMKGFFDKIYLNRYAFPESFDDQKSRSQIKNCGFNNGFEVLNFIFSQIDIEPLDLELLTPDASYDFIHIQFHSDVTSYNTENKKKKNVLHNFIIFFCCDDGSPETNSYRILYQKKSYFTSYISSLLKCQYIKNAIIESEINEETIKDFETVLIATCQYLHIELPEIVSAPNLLLEEFTQHHFEELLCLITRNKVELKIIKKQAKKMFAKHKLSSEENEFYEDNYEFFESVNCWNSDWKFEPEDAEYFISEMIEDEFSFDYPEETYSHDLFPYLQSALAKRDLELMSINTMCDSYLFFVAYRGDVSRILELANILDVQIDRL